MRAVNYLGYVLNSNFGGGGGGGGSFSAGISGGNTAGDTGTVSNRIVFAGGNNITVSGSTNAGGMSVTISGGAAGGGVITFFATGNTTQSTTGTQSVDSVLFRGEGAVSVGVSNGSIVVSAPNTIAQSNQTLEIYHVGNTTGQSSRSTYDARTLSFNAAGIVSMGWSNGSVYVSATQSNQAFDAGGVVSAFQTLVFQNSNGVSFSNNAGSVRVTHDLQFTSNTSNITSNALHSSAARVFNIVAATNNTGGGTASLSSNVSFSAANGITFYTSAGNAVVASYTVPTQTNQQMTLFATGNTTQSSTGTTNASSIIFRGEGIVSAGITGGSIVFSATQSNQAFSAAGGASNFQTLSFSDNAQASWTNTNGQVALTNVRMSASATGNTVLSSTQTFNLSSIVFAGSGIASVGLSAGTVVISVPAGGGAGDGGNVVMVSTGGHTAGNTGSTSTGTIVFEGSNSLTLSFISNAGGVHTLRFIPAMSQLTAGNANISLSTNGSTVSILGIGAGTGFTAGTTSGSDLAGTLSTNGLSLLLPRYVKSGFYPYADLVKVIGQQGQGTLGFDPMYVGAPFQCDRIAFGLHNTNSSNSSGSHTLSFWVGIYTRNASTLSLLTSTSSTTAITHSGTAGSYSLYSGGPRLFTIPFTTTLTQGDYWLAVASRTTSGGANGSYSQELCSNLGSNFLGHFGSSHNTTYQYTIGQGVYTATTSGIPNSVGFTQIRGSDSMARRAPALMFASGTV